MEKQSGSLDAAKLAWGVIGLFAFLALAALTAIMFGLDIGSSVM